MIYFKKSFYLVILVILFNPLISYAKNYFDTNLISYWIEKKGNWRESYNEMLITHEEDVFFISKEFSYIPDCVSEKNKNYQRISELANDVFINDDIVFINPTRSFTSEYKIICLKNNRAVSVYAFKLIQDKKKDIDQFELGLLVIELFRK